ncbi:MAG: pyruvate, phosphate dikinase [Clostridiales bacterium]|nr:pyruvate, phosphate dikinase [Clostridiales bacterium]
MAHKYVYLFSEGNANMRELLGGKGANLAEMTNIGMPVPQGFTITTEACTQYYEDGQKINDEIQAEIMEYIVKMEEITGKKFGDLENPLLVSVRSGARASMPGMMDTILNLGLNEEVVEVIAKQSNNPRWAWDCYRRFIQMYSDVVMEVGKKYFEQLIDQMKEKKGVTQDVELTADDLKELAGQFKAEYKAKIGSDFPSDPKEQLMGAIKAVFRSWDNPRANVYRRDNDIPYSWGTAVNVQSMAFGNMGDDCGTGVAFTRNPATGEKKLFGEFLTNAQGEDVVAGVRTPMPIAEMAEKFPEAFAQFEDVCKRLEDHYRDMQDMEFTVEHGKLYMLQTRNGKRTPAAALKIACDLVDEGMIDEKKAVAMIEPRSLDTLLHPQFDGEALKEAPMLATALGASPGAASGKIVFSAEEAKEWAARGEKVVLVRLETSPEDIEGMKAAQGILTVRGGMTSHAAVVARGMGKCCVSGCGEIKMDEENKQFELAGKTFHEGDWISLDGSTGKIYDGPVPTVPATIGGEFGRVMGWADKYRRLEVRTNADTPHDAAQAKKFGAQGIGLCRTEHMFFNDDRIPAIREMICSDTVEQREKALAKLEPMQQSDFEGIYEAMEGLPVTIRFLDPPLHEFVPTEEADIEKLADDMGKSVADIKAIIAGLHEFNPMMGHRGCRLAVTYPEIAVMQTNAVIKAALAVQARHPEWNLVPEIMIPLVGEVKEFLYVKNIVTSTADKLINQAGSSMKYKVGTMIEIPRAAMTADEISPHANFFSFGSNDLTQMTFGFSRDDAGKFLGAYYEKKIYEQDPFAKLDQHGVGRLISNATRWGRSTNPDIHVGICGEHGGDPSSVEFCHKIGLDYVSCSPFRVPIARLAAAQAAIKDAE